MAQAYRVIHGYAELADLIGIDQHRLERLMTERDYQLPIADMEAIADALYVPRRWLTDESSPKIPIWAISTDRGSPDRERLPVESSAPTDFTSWMAALDAAWHAYLHQDGDQPGSSKSASRMLKASKLAWPKVHRSAVLKLGYSLLDIRHFHELAVMLGVPGTPDLKTLTSWRQKAKEADEALQRSTICALIGKILTDGQWSLMKIHQNNGTSTPDFTRGFWPFGVASGGGSCYERLVKELSKAKNEVLRKNPPRRRRGRPAKGSPTYPDRPRYLVDAYCEALLGVFRHQFPDDHPMNIDEAVTEYRRIQKLRRISFEEQQKHVPERAVNDVEYNLLRFLGRGQITAWAKLEEFAKAGGIQKHELVSIIRELEAACEVHVRRRRGFSAWVLCLGPGDREYLAEKR